MQKIIVKLTILMIPVLSLFCPIIVGQEQVDFDPFSPGGTSSTWNQSTSGPMVPQVQFNNNDISMVFQIISDATGWSIFPTSDVSKAKISLWAQRISAQELLDTVITMAGFVYHRENDVITVMTYDEYMQYHGLAKEIFALEFATAASVDATIKPFLTKLGKSVVHNQTNTIVLYETQANLKFIKSVIEKLDSPSENIIIEVIHLEYADSEAISKILQSIFTSQQKEFYNKPVIEETKGNESDQIAIDLPGNSIGIYANTPANQLIIVGTKNDIEKIKTLLAAIDVYGDNMMLEVINLKYADSELLAGKLQQLFSNEQGNENSAIYKHKDSIMDPSSQSQITNFVSSPQAPVFIEPLGRTNQLIIKAYKADIEKLRRLVEKLDHYVEPVSKNYQLIYIDASEIVTGLEKILNLDRTNTRSREESREKQQGITLVSKTNSILLTGPPSAHRIMASIVENIDKASTYETGMIRIYKLENADVEEVAKTVTELLRSDSEEEKNSSKVNFTEKKSSSTPANSQGTFAQSEEFVPHIEARVSISQSTNSIVVQATSRQHRELDKLIKELDARRKQVLIEAMIVEVITTDDLNVGVELSHASLDAIAFTAFGLSTNLDPATGVRDIIVSPGGTAAVLRPDKVQAIVQLLKKDGNARITSAPRILVNDNAVGFINSIAEEPTTQTNQGETTTTTSFAGFVEAGTQFAITPHISEKNYLRVEYQITLNSFGTKPTDPSIPPPRNTSSIQSEATVPNGSTIVVGGLQTAEESENVDKIPILGDIPILGWAFKNTKIEKQYKTTYLFITPHIMENESFSDLTKASDKALREINGSKIKNQEDISDINASGQLK